MKTFEETLNNLKKFNQEHLLNFYNELNDEEKENLLNQISSIDFNLMQNLYAQRNETPDTNKRIENIETLKKDKLSKEEKEQLYKIGEEIIKNKQIAVCQMAGRTRNKTWP